jgi:thioredoxin reductase
MAFKRSLIADVPKNREAGFQKQGIDAFHGRARLSEPGTVVVGEDVLESRYIVIAGGAKPASLAISGADHLVTSEQFLELDRLPPRIVFVGGGYISFELAHIATRAGATATILHRGDRPLSSFDPDLVDMLVARTRALGIDVKLQTEVIRIDRRPDGLHVEATTAGQTRGFTVDMVVHGAGRVPEIDDLALDAAAIAWDIHGVKVNQYLQSVSNASVYAAGDAAASGGPRLTPVAGYDGQIVASNLLNGNHSVVDYSVVPSVVFTIPPLASVGLHEHEARERGLSFESHYEQTASWFAARRIGEPAAGFRCWWRTTAGACSALICSDPLQMRRSICSRWQCAVGCPLRRSRTWCFLIQPSRLIFDTWCELPSAMIALVWRFAVWSHSSPSKAHRSSGRSDNSKARARAGGVKVVTSAHVHRLVATWTPQHGGWSHMFDHSHTADSIREASMFSPAVIGTAWRRTLTTKHKGLSQRLHARHQRRLPHSRDFERFR